MPKQNQFLIHSDLPGSLTLNIEPEGTFFPMGRGEEVSVTDVFVAEPVTLSLSAGVSGSPIVTIWPGDGEVRVEKDRVDIFDLLQRDSVTDISDKAVAPAKARKR